jgi:PEGA domain
LRVVSEPSAASVAVNGRRRGTTPAQITDLPAGSHEVTVSGTGGTVRQRVQVSPGATTTVMVPLPAAAPPQSTGGWLSITAPTELQVFEGDRLLGTTRVNPLMLPTGTHTLRLSSESAGVNLTRVVSIARGRTARLEVRVPPGTLSANAVPWASVSIDGRDVGETPLGGVELSPGTHDVSFTHPELGQRRQQVTVRSGATTRVSVDLRR